VKKHVVIVGGGFGGLEAAKALAGANVRVTLVDRTNHHLFQPLLYQVAMAGLSPAEIAAPIRSILEEQEHVSVLLAEVVNIELEPRRLTLRTRSHSVDPAPSDTHAEPERSGMNEAEASGEPDFLFYDYLIVATGAKTSYFGHDEWKQFAPGLKCLSDALTIRNRVLMAFERAERCLEPERQKSLLSFVVIGGGPTGVELAGAIAELAQHTLSGDFRSAKPQNAKVTLIEAGPRLLASFSTDLSESAKEQLGELNVEVRLNACVTHIDASGVTVASGETIKASVVVWGAGVCGTQLLESLGAARDNQGRVLVEPDCSIRNSPEVFVIGDAAHFDDRGEIVPGVSPAAMQQGRYVARIIAGEAQEGIVGQRTPFRYKDKGSMATVGRSRAVAEAGSIKMRGLLAWLAWLFIHVFYLIGFRSRVVVLFTWFWSYLSYRRGARLITERLPNDTV
jgi:NADH:ubiquinone reductase (H+-translocating)